MKRGKANAAIEWSRNGSGGSAIMAQYLAAANIKSARARPTDRGAPSPCTPCVQLILIEKGMRNHDGSIQPLPEVCEVRSTATQNPIIGQDTGRD